MTAAAVDVEAAVAAIVAVAESAVVEFAAVEFVGESVVELVGVVGLVAAPVDAELVEVAVVVAAVGERDS